MSFDRKFCTTLAALTAVFFSACDSKTEPEPPTTQEVGDVVALTVSGRIVSFNRAAPNTLVGNVAVTGLPAGESLLGIDYRPSNSELYGLSSGGKLFTIKPDTGVATLKSTLAAMSGDDNPFTALSGRDFGVDFNPVADRLRVVSDTGQNLRINVETGATTTDGNINGGNGAAVTAAAYTNSVPGATSTQLYVLDDDTGTLYLQDPPNNGTLTRVVSLSTDVTSVNGYDIDGRTNVGYLAVSLGGTPYLYRLDPSQSPPAVQLSEIGVDEAIQGLALR